MATRAALRPWKPPSLVFSTNGLPFQIARPSESDEASWPASHSASVRRSEARSSGFPAKVFWKKDSPPKSRLKTSEGLVSFGIGVAGNQLSRRVEARADTRALELTGADEAPGVVEGGVLNQESRELNIEALPGDIPDSIIFDVSKMEMNATATLSELTPPDGVTFLDDPEETVLATITPPTLEPVEEEIETETELVGEGEAPEDGEAAEGQAEGDTGAEAEQATGGDTE